MGDVRLLDDVPDEAVVSALALDAALELSAAPSGRAGGAAPTDPVVALGGALRRLSDPAGPEWTTRAPAPGGRATPAPSPRRRREALVAVAAAAVTVAGVGALALGAALGGPPAGLPAAALRTGRHGVLVLLTSAGSGRSGSVVTGMACTGARTCLAVASDRRGAPGSILARSGDGGSTWSQVASPRATVAGVACPTERRCVAVGSSAGRGVVLSSADGGRTWATGDVPVGVTALSGIACPSSAVCWAVGEARAVPALLVSSDGARTWRRQAPPTGLSTATAIACPTTLACEVGGSAGRRPAFASTADGGARWAPAPAPAPTGLSGAVRALTCPSPQHCWAVATGRRTVAVFTSGATGTWRLATDGPVPAAGMADGGGPSCGSPCGEVAAGPALRLLEGRWAAPTGGRLRLDALTCPAAPQCWVVQPAGGGFTATATLTAAAG